MHLVGMVVKKRSFHRQPAEISTGSDANRATPPAISFSSHAPRCALPNLLAASPVNCRHWATRKGFGAAQTTEQGALSPCIKMRENHA